MIRAILILLSLCSVSLAQQVTTTATGSGYYKVYVDGEFVSQHTTERKAVESAANQALANRDAVVEYRQELVVTVSAKDVPPPAPDPEPEPEPEPEPAPRVTVDGGKIYVDGRHWIDLNVGTATGGDHLTIDVPANSYVLGVMHWEEPVVYGPGSVTFTKPEQPQTFWIRSGDQAVHFVGPSACYGGGATTLCSMQLPEPSKIEVYWTDSVDDLGPKRAALEAFAEQYPMVLDWPDRRPIGLSFPNQHVNGGNRWLWNWTTPAEFAEGYRQHIQACIDNTKSVNGQGVIIWSIEGQPFGHPISYIGDPSRCGEFCPEMSVQVAKELCKQITDAGLLVGVCVRPNQMRKVDWNTFGWWQFNVANDEYERQLRTKIRWAYDELGARLFYVDSVQRSDSISRDPQYNDPPFAGAIMPPVGIFQRLAAEFPDALLIPEQSMPAYRSVTCPFTPGLSGPGADMQYAYPATFNFLFGQNANHGDPAVVEQVRAGMAAGNIATFNSWYPSPELQTIKQIRESAL